MDNTFFYRHVKNNYPNIVIDDQKDYYNIYKNIKSRECCMRCNKILGINIITTISYLKDDKNYSCLSHHPNCVNLTSGSIKYGIFICYLTQKRVIGFMCTNI